MFSDDEKIYGLIGFPLTHSFSQGYFTDKFKDENIPAKYLNFELPDIGDLMEVISEYPTLAGLNVTIPYKEKVIPYLDRLSETAKKIGAVNVIKFIRKTDGDLILEGHNSDIIGFCNSIAPLLNENRKRALVLGTGGASKAVCAGLEDLGVTPTLVSRSKREGLLTYDEITPFVMQDNLIIVNTTPVGMYPHDLECPNIPYNLLTPEHLCYDLIYNPDITMFMRLAREQGAEVKNGLEMLLLQAFESWRIWNE